MYRDLRRYRFLAIRMLNFYPFESLWACGRQIFVVHYSLDLLWVWRVQMAKHTRRKDWNISEVFFTRRFDKSEMTLLIQENILIIANYLPDCRYSNGKPKLSQYKHIYRVNWWGSNVLHNECRSRLTSWSSLLVR